MLKIAILVGEWEQDGPNEGEGEQYLIWDMCDALRRRGHRVRVVRGVCGEASDSSESEQWDVCVVHIDLTRTPAEFVDFANTYRVVVNGELLDISKRVVSRCLVSRGDGYKGAVIVKTDLNHGGVVERRMSRWDGAWGRRQLASARRRLPWTMQPSMLPEQYRVYESRVEVPRAVWWNPGLVVERFVPEFHGELYWVRMWLFFGDRGYVRSMGCAEPVSKFGCMKEMVQGDQGDSELLPIAVRERRAELGLDFGKIDYVVCDGEAIVLDVNRTPMGSVCANEKLRHGEVMADGLEELVREWEAG